MAAEEITLSGSLMEHDGQLPPARGAHIGTYTIFVRSKDDSRELFKIERRHAALVRARSKSRGALEILDVVHSPENTSEKQFNAVLEW